MSYQDIYYIAHYIDGQGIKGTTSFDQFLSYLKKFKGIEDVKLDEVENGFLLNAVIFGSPVSFLYIEENKQEEIVVERFRTDIVVFLKDLLLKQHIELKKGVSLQ